MPSPSLNALIDLALTAGREILAVKEAGFDAQRKFDGSPVTIADQRAEKIIEEGLARLAPNVPMIGEESVSEGRIPEPGQLFYCVDPLDGTRAFVEGRDDYTVNIALVESGAPKLGVVFAPATGELFAGEPGCAVAGEFDAHSGRAVKALHDIRSQHAKPARWRIVASSHSGRNEKTQKFIAKLDGLATHASSSIKFCRVADGSADLYPRFGEVSEWDAAAGHAVLSAAGGGIMRLDGAPIVYGARPKDFNIAGFVAFASAEAAAAALKALA